MSENLSVRQTYAAELTDRIALISAGPGTGKTHTLINRIFHLLAVKKVPKESVVAITFTKKAAAELRERLEKLTDGALPFVGTIHAFALEIVAGSGEKVEFLSEADRFEIIKKIKNDKIDNVSLHISKQKNRACGGVCDAIVKKYNELVAAQGKVDYDDIILRTIDILRSEKGKATIRELKHVLIDEFQDTSELQYELIKQLLSSGANLFAIGDPYQSIYGFRGAGADIFKKAAADFPRSVSLQLDMNFRSVPEIVRCAEGIFPQKTALISHRRHEGSVRIVETLDEQTEAAYIIREINGLIGGIDLLSAPAGSSRNQTMRISDVAVIYRAHHLRRPILRVFADSGIPYQVIGEGSPFLQPDIQFVISCLRAVSSAGSIIKDDIFDLQALSKADVDEVIENCRRRRLKVSETADYIIQSCKLELFEKAGGDRKYDWLQLRQALLPFDMYDNGLNRALAYIDYLSTHEFFDPKTDRVTLTTIHAAKGLEFKAVFIAGFEDGILPLRGRKAGRFNDIEEEKRLFYVAATRARDHLVITHARTRSGKIAKISPFANLIKTNSNILIDPELPRIEKKRITEKDKSNQMKIF